MKSVDFDVRQAAADTSMTIPVGDLFQLDIKLFFSFDVFQGVRIVSFALLYPCDKQKGVMSRSCSTVVVLLCEACGFTTMLTSYLLCEHPDSRVGGSISI